MNFYLRWFLTSVLIGSVLGILFLLTNCTQAGAGEPILGTKSKANVLCPVDRVYQTPEQKDYCDHRPITWAEFHVPRENRLYIGDDCLATMEAAMKAMEPFMDKWEINSHGEVSYTLAERRRYVLREFDNAEFQDYARQHMAVTQQWAEAKRCWRTP